MRQPIAEGIFLRIAPITAVKYQPNTIDTRNPHRKLPHRVTYNAEGLEGKQFHTHLYPVTEREDAPLFV